MREVRVYFNKTGLAQYISHLDLMRTMTRAITRAKIQLWYTEGFNPRLFMTFALPLSLGIESYSESMDIKITDDMSNDEIKSKLNSAMPSGLEVTFVSEEFMKPNEIAFAEYKVSFDFCDKSQAESFLNQIKILLENDELTTMKSAKKKGRKTEIEVNLKDYIESFKLSENENSVLLNIVLSAGSSKNINPIILIDRLNRDIETKPEFTKICKNRLFTEDMKEFR